MILRSRKIDLAEKMTGDGVTDNYAVLQDALNGGDRSIHLPPGRFLISKTLKVFSNTRIIADTRTVLKLAAHTGKRFDDWLLTNADHEKGNSDIEIAGGIWDVNGKENPRGVPEQLDDYGGVGIYFLRMSHLILKNLTVANPDSFFVMLCETEDFRVENVKLFNDNPKINQDGIHVGGFCRNGLIRKLHAISPLTPGDDLVALNANDGARHFTHGQKPGPIENIVIDHDFLFPVHAYIM
ncbi:MAG: glycosyl hydrolase family 28-related protein [Spirochaetota bacterium]